MWQQGLDCWDWVSSSSGSFTLLLSFQQVENIAQAFLIEKVCRYTVYLSIRKPVYTKDHLYVLPIIMLCQSCFLYLSISVFSHLKISVFSVFLIGLLWLMSPNKWQKICDVWINRRLDGLRGWTLFTRGRMSTSK